MCNNSTVLAKWDNQISQGYRIYRPVLYATSLNYAFQVGSPTISCLYWQLCHMVPTFSWDLKIQSHHKSSSSEWDRMFYTHHLIFINDHWDQRGSGDWETGLPRLLISTWITALVTGKVFFNRFVSHQQTKELERDLVLLRGLSPEIAESGTVDPTQTAAFAALHNDSSCAFSSSTCFWAAETEIQLVRINRVLLKLRPQ